MSGVIFTLWVYLTSPSGIVTLHTVDYPTSAKCEAAGKAVMDAFTGITMPAGYYVCTPRGLAN